MAESDEVLSTVYDAEEQIHAAEALIGGEDTSFNADLIATSNLAIARSILALRATVEHELGKRS